MEPSLPLVEPARTPVARLAPSPTGGLHAGHARTFLLAWLAARSGGGRVILRIEDLDASRVRAEALRGTIADLTWLGLDWDDGPFLQSHRVEHYAAALERLRMAGLLYPCTCTRADIERAASAPHAEDEGPTYPGICAQRSSEPLDRAPYSWRFRVPRDGAPIAWDDLFLGHLARDPARLGGDFPVARQADDLSFSYQLAVVVDDAHMGVTQVIRGDDLVSSTPRQLLLYRALGFTPPAFGHVPLAVTPDGRRLAKRDGSIKLETLRLGGVDPRRFVGVLARSCGWSGAIEPSLPHDWIPRFDLATIPRVPWVVGPELLDALRTG